MTGLNCTALPNFSANTRLYENKKKSTKLAINWPFVFIFSIFLLAILPTISVAGEPASSDSITTAEKTDKALHRFDPIATKQLIQGALTAFYTPGMSVGVVHQGEVVFLDGFGQRNIQERRKVNADTYFRLASTSKAFTAAAVGILVDQGKLNWTDKVTQYLPEFQMQDAWVTREFTIKDLLVHHSGLAGGAGDSMIWPEPSGFSRAEVIHNLRYLTPLTSFRTEFAYSNVLYITAGEIIAKVSGMRYGDFIEQSIFAPLDMTCFAGDVPSVKLKNSAMSYAHNDNKGLYPVPRNSIQRAQQMSVAAGGIVCNARSMTKWVKALLSPETLPFSMSVLNAVWSPQTVLTISDSEEEWDNTLFKTYGLGWRIADMLGYKLISHTGTLSGYQAYVALLPELEVGVVVLNNGSNYGARSSVMQHILKSFIPSSKLPEDSPSDWVKAFVDLQAKQEANYLANYEPVREATTLMQVSNKQIIGTYQDNWFGRMLISGLEASKSLPNENHLRIESERMITLKGNVIPYEGNLFKVEWDNTNAASNAFLIIETNFKNEVTGLKMHPFVAKEKKRHEYRDMHFVKQTLSIKD
ncbi:serine hydrolase [Glaciecola sp. 33A]|uniref:serine hydrolase n=1 Tax=Glaciecola sp. 33A TaxID=2057807 RepID=UPI000C343727|nr:serine hydrolase [Glaciecola sp. 33A]PKI02402.1 serine hydrolase [Glaciecola sp. 33A]